MRIEDKYKSVVAELNETNAMLEDFRRDVKVSMSERRYYAIVNDVNQRAKIRGGK